MQCGVTSSLAREPSIEDAPACVVELSAPLDVSHETIPLDDQTPLLWRPAEDVLPLVPMVDSIPGHEYVTYSRKHKNKAVVWASAATLAEASDEFIGSIAQDLRTVLPTPARPALRDRQITNFVPAPRCSCRIAKLPPKFDF